VQGCVLWSIDGATQMYDRLRLDAMTTKITKVASFQETICRPHERVIFCAEFGASTRCSVRML
jgi:hypothetical protein